MMVRIEWEMGNIVSVFMIIVYQFVCLFYSGNLRKCGIVLRNFVWCYFKEKHENEEYSFCFVWFGVLFCGRMWKRCCSVYALIALII